jgi:cytochrome c553
MNKWCMALLALLPPLALGANATQQDFARVIAAKPDTARGAELFEPCKACHGQDGGGTPEGSVPRIAGQHYRVLVRQIVDFRHGTRWNFRMEGVATSHNVLPELQDVADVASFVSKLDVNGVRGVGDGQYVDKGAAIYKSQCAECHGNRGEGDNARGVPRIAGQHAGYLMRQIYDAVDGRRPPLTKSHGKRFEPLVFEEVLGLADYVARLGWQTEGGAASSAAPASAPR